MEFSCKNPPLVSVNTQQQIREQMAKTKTDFIYLLVYHNLVVIVARILVNFKAYKGKLSCPDWHCPYVCL